MIAVAIRLSVIKKKEKEVSCFYRLMQRKELTPLRQHPDILTDAQGRQPLPGE
jgi:hypothetical protein